MFPYLVNVSGASFVFMRLLWMTLLLRLAYRVHRGIACTVRIVRYARVFTQSRHLNSGPTAFRRRCRRRGAQGCLWGWRWPRLERLRGAAQPV